MKTNQFIRAAIMTAALTVVCQATNAQHMISDKATKVAREFVSLVHDERQETIGITPLTPEDLFTKVLATTSSKVCELTLKRDLAANPDGWVVVNHSCKSSTK